MGLFDSIADAVNRGGEQIERTTEASSLRSQSEKLLRQRREYAAQLGASLYEETRGNPTFTKGREQLYDGISAIDEERRRIDARLADLAAEQERIRMESATYPCIYCRSIVSARDVFCKDCGKPVADTIAAFRDNDPSAPTSSCPQCGSPVRDDHAFCMECGFPLRKAAAAPEAGAAQATPTDNGDQSGDGGQNGE